jgi:phytoene dehydrogenase-like protein
MSKKIIIVGAGISGLSAGCYAQMNGYQTSIFEMHNIPGGLCTAWKRKGFTFDISMHMVTASRSGPMHKVWDELGIARKFTFHYHDHALQVEGKGKKLLFCTDRKKLEKSMLDISPADSRLIKEFTSLIFGPDMMNVASLKPKEMKNLLDKAAIIPVMIPFMGKFIKYNKMTLQEFAGRFKDPFLGEAVRFFIDGPGWPMPDFPMVVLTGFMKNAVSEAGTPAGGSQQVMFHLEKLYRELGGEVYYKSTVKDLIIENDRVKGIRIDNGSETRADHVIWAADGRSLIFKILQGKYLNEKIRNMYENWTPVKPILHVMMGVDMDFSTEPHRVTFETDEPVIVGDRENRWITILHHCFDKTMAPAGKSVVEAWYDTEYDYWEALSKDRQKYLAEKNRIAEQTINLLDKRWPGFASRVETVDVPTPATYERYTGNWLGSPDGWYLTTHNFTEMEPVRNLPGLECLHMAGQWTAPYTGTIIAAISGRQVIECLCRREKIYFTSVPQPSGHYAG